MGNKWELRTPGLPPPEGPYEGRPGESETISARRAPVKPAAKQEPKSKWSTTKRVLSLVPWGALVACAFMLTERWGDVKFGFIHFIGGVSFTAILLPMIWFTLNCLFLAAWAMAMYTLRQSCAQAVVTLQQADMSNVTVTELVRTKNGLCPAAGCFKMMYYPWLHSNACLCTAKLVSDLQGNATTAMSALIWTLSGAGCLWFGALIAAVQGAADLALLKVVWRWMPTKSKKPSSPVKRQPVDDYATPGSALPKRSIYAVNAYSPSPYGAGFYSVRSPDMGYM